MSVDGNYIERISTVLHIKYYNLELSNVHIFKTILETLYWQYISIFILLKCISIDHVLPEKRLKGFHLTLYMDYAIAILK